MHRSTEFALSSAQSMIVLSVAAPARGNDAVGADRAIASNAQQRFFVELGAGGVVLRERAATSSSGTRTTRAVSSRASR